MQLLDVMTEVAERVNGVGGLRGFATPPDQAAPPFACCGGPEAPDYPITYNRGAIRGAGRLTLPLLVAVGKASDRSSWKALLAYISDEGPNSVIAALEVPDEYTAFDTLQVKGWEIGEATLADVVYLAVTFDIDIIG